MGKTREALTNYIKDTIEQSDNWNKTPETIKKELLRQKFKMRNAKILFTELSKYHKHCKRYGLSTARAYQLNCHVYSVLLLVKT